jgi:tRNA A-37 threonylcarbamoyl transferase component Bud32
MPSPAPLVQPSTPEAITFVRRTGEGDLNFEAPAAVLEPGHTSDHGSGPELMIAPGTLLGGRYVVDGALAEGGMGIVYVGHHAELGHRVAIKFLRREVSDRPSVVQRFLNEGRSAASLRSEHVVRVMDVGQLDSGRPYLVMEHLEGTDLDALLGREGVLEVDRAIEYVLQVCAALSEAHGSGIVHRDIKPENLFLVESAERPLVKVLDFGLAKRIDSVRAMGLTGPQDSMGSPYYMSPEQIVAPQDVDERTDIWSLGVVLYRLLTDTLPFAGDTVLEVYAHVINAEPAPITRFRPELHRELDEIVRRCLQKNVQQRYQSIQELSQDLLRYRLERLERRGRAPVSTPPVFVDDTPIQIPGVRSRWPVAVLLLLFLAAAAVYAADRTGRINARSIADRFTNTVLESDLVHSVAGGWLTSPSLTPSPDEPMLERPFLPTLLGPAAGVFLRDRALGARGSMTLPAERERDRETIASAKDETQATRDGRSTDAARPREVEYRRYLQENGLVPLKDALEKLNGETPRAE